MLRLHPSPRRARMMRDRYHTTVDVGNVARAVSL
jgi:hypothetical protein